MMMIIAAVFGALVALVLQVLGALGPLLAAVALVLMLIHGVPILLRALEAFLGGIEGWLRRAGGS